MIAVEVEAPSGDEHVAHQLGPVVEQDRQREDQLAVSLGVLRPHLATHELERIGVGLVELPELVGEQVRRGDELREHARRSAGDERAARGARLTSQTLAPLEGLLAGDGAVALLGRFRGAEISEAQAAVELADDAMVRGEQPRVVAAQHRQDVALQHLELVANTLVEGAPRRRHAAVRDGFDRDVEPGALVDVCE